MKATYALDAADKSTGMTLGELAGFIKQLDGAPADTEVRVTASMRARIKRLTVEVDDGTTWLG